MPTDTWNTTVSDLMLTFRQTLVVLVPVLEKARIPIGVHAGGDAWDEISEALFRQIVGESVRWSLAEDRIDGFRLPKYEMYYEDYSPFSALIFVEGGQIGGEDERWRIFHSFSDESGKPDLNQVAAVPVDKKFLPVGSAECLRLGDCTFRCILREPGREVAIIDSLTVRL